MQYKNFLLAAALLAAPTFASAQEAFIAQVGGLTVEVPAPTRVEAEPIVASLVSTLDLTVPESPIEAGLFDGFDFPPVPVSGAFSSITQTGDSNTAMVMQEGLQASLVMQTGMNNVASVFQGGGMSNQAAVYQSADNGTAAITQRGSNNRAMIIQN